VPWLVTAFLALATRRQSRAAFSGPAKEWDAPFAFEDDKSSAESADKSAHSKTRRDGVGRARKRTLVIGEMAEFTRR
jgi:hypothetical protein